MTRKITKTCLVKEIRQVLADKGVVAGGCVNLNIKLSDGVEIAWVSTTQVLIRKHVDGALYKLTRLPLYSKETSIAMLTVIRTALDKDIK